MPSEDNIKSTANERSWEYAIKSGRINLGNLQVNLDFIKETGLINPNKKVLELGCGSGQLASVLCKQGASMIASDIAQTAIDHARKLHPEVDFRTHSAEALPYEDGSFDIVMSFDVLEHLPNVDQHLREVRRVLKPGGHYLLQTPNKASNAIFETLKCRSLQWKKYHPSLHFFGQLRHRLNRNGFFFRCVKMNTMNEFVVNKIKKVGLPTWLFAWINFRYIPFSLQTNFYVIAQKTESKPSLNKDQ
jgi:2-polyprenyl-3-methyl-5-hydroxy-6-metoxy-1,4-benzoquinol methylase